jgi:nitrate reductase gamma subunit
MEQNWRELISVAEETRLKKQLFFLFAFTSVAILIATLAVVRGYASLEAVSFALVAVFGLASGLLLWWNRNRKQEAHTSATGNRKFAFLWLLAPFTASAVVALIQSMHEKWDIGDTIGASFFVLFASLSIYETIRRSRSKDAK